MSRTLTTQAQTKQSSWPGVSYGAVKVVTTTIVEKYYLRQVKVGHSRASVTLYVFYTYRKSRHGAVKAANREVAKRAILKLEPRAEFFR